MKSFKRSLIINFIGVIIINFLLIYILFNYFVNEYIESEARRQFDNILSNIFPQHHSDIKIFEIHPNHLNANTTLIYDVVSPHQTIIPSDFMRAGGASDIITYHEFIIEKSLTRLEDINSESSIIDYIIISANDVMPLDSILSQSGVLRVYADNIGIPYINTIIEDNEDYEQTRFLLDYYDNNDIIFKENEMIKVTHNNNTFYLRMLSTDDISSYLILAYSDITHATHFVNTINTILMYILIISGIITIIIGVRISAKFERLLLQLSNFAECIGRGNFTDRLSNFRYKEFNMISESMNKMSLMLYKYENKQKQFFQNVSHELRTPLMSIQGYSEGILENIIDKTEAAEVICEESKKMTNLITQLLLISRMDNDLETLDMKYIDIKSIINKCIKELEIIAKNSSKIIVLDFPRKDINFKADEEKLTRALINIITNCIRHANTKVTIYYYTQDNILHLTVSDDGFGINIDDMPFIFDRFYKGKNGNTGLGLSISKDIIKAHNGNIQANNSDLGAVFHITLPIN